MPDNRVQCCLSFIVPSGHGLTPLDIEFMKCLHEKVNIIPLIAKADTLTPEECQQFKKQSLQYCLGTSGNSKPRPHMKKTGKGFVTMENTCRAKASASAEGNDTAGGRRRKRRTSFTRSLDHVSMPTDAKKKRSMIFPNFGIFRQALFHANKGKKNVTQHPEGRKATSLSPSAEAKQACGPPYASFLLLTF
ncbi:uncharacterized protein [Symphalangus syndactylus]|uniref:uncharacterized protein isoform X5 n=1 Tax=Symphalangus syndactylus TaxID=9590 RepID=UPI002441ACFC|nr:uncharacterized protein LOC129472916 isoform X4 [Symphalangus syndactylus]